jgi:hypothetical protein
MTEFRSKGKGGERKIYPLGRPYGEDRTDAEKAVQRLREENERARLIETNRKHKLYAPYVSTLKLDEMQAKNEEPKPAETSKPAGTPVEKPAEDRGRPLSSGEMTELTRRLNELNVMGVNRKGELKFLNDFYNGTITPKDVTEGHLIQAVYDPWTKETNVGIMNKNHVYMVYTSVNGKADITPYQFSHYKTQPVESKVKPDALYDFLRTINRFNSSNGYKLGGFDGVQAIVVDKPSGQDEITISPQFDPDHTAVAAQELPKLKLKATSGIDRSVHAVFSVEYMNEFVKKFKPAIKDKEINFDIPHPENLPKDSGLMDISTEIGTTKFGFLLAPRVE